MNVDEHLLVTLSEECSELQKVIAKALRFGLDDAWRDTEYTDSPRNLIKKELNDVYAVAEMLSERKVLPFSYIQERLIKAKKDKVTKFFDYAREQGTLQ